MELFDSETDSFLWYQRLSLTALTQGLTWAGAASEFLSGSVDSVAAKLTDFFSDYDREKKGGVLAENLLEDFGRGEEGVFLHSPPEVKGIVLDSLLYDWWATPGFLDENDKKVEVTKKILPTFQSWRDFHETVVRMNPDGIARPDEFDNNLVRLFDFVRMGNSERQLFIHQLKDKVAIASRPVKLDPFGVCRVCNIA